MLIHPDPTIQAAIESGMNCYNCRSAAVLQVTGATPPHTHAHWLCPRCNSTFNQLAYPRKAPFVVIVSEAEAQTISAERVAPQKPTAADLERNYVAAIERWQLARDAADTSAAATKTLETLAAKLATEVDTAREQYAAEIEAQ